MIEARQDPATGDVAIRNDRDIPNGGVVVATHEEWVAFLEEIRAQGRDQLIAALEQPRSALCTCDEYDPPMNWGARIDHHCDCPAVKVVATLLHAYSRTAHARQCDHGTEMDKFYAVPDEGGRA